MSLYSIEDTTLTALGDAVRNKTSQYISVDELPASTFEVSCDTREMEYKIENGVRKFDIPVNLREILGDDAYNSMTNLYISCNYQSYVGGDFTYWPGRCRIYFGISVFDILKSNSPLENEKNLTIELQPHELSQPNVYIELSASDWSFTDEPYDAWFKGNIKIWAMDSNSSYLKYNSFTPLEMADTINGLLVIPDEALTITDNCQYRFGYNGLNWLIKECGNKINTNDITNATYMFYGSDKLSEIPFKINLVNNSKIEGMFNICQDLIYAPEVNMENLTTHLSFGNVFAYCSSLKEIPEWFIELLEKDYNLSTNNSTFGPWSRLFEYCFSIRKIPDRVMRFIRNDKMTGNYYGVCYSKPFGYMRCLDELVGIHCDNYNYTSNQFGSFFNGLYRVKDITFATNDDGTLVIRPWKSQTIDMTYNIGYAGYNTQITIDTNAGITADKEVKDDATYQALKNDPDWFSCDINYSRYNHDSAVNTINSLPDCSATGTNTIKFKGASGALTDGGAINTLTEEEIAVATVKGWTITFA